MTGADIPAGPLQNRTQHEGHAGQAGYAAGLNTGQGLRLDAAASGNRFALLDLLKAVASHLIVLHHLAFYGPMADHARTLAPGLIDFLGGEARMVVQVFLVGGGFMLARSFAFRASTISPNAMALGKMVLQRFVKLVPPYMVAILLALASYELASRAMTHHSISPMPGIEQLLAHALLLHGILGFDGLTAGAWYVAIDFQLFALFAGALWLGARTGASWAAPALAVLLVLASLLHFNRDPAWDAWALYFAGSYGLGVLAWGACDPERSRRERLALLCAVMLPALLALALDFRTRIALALLTALVLMMGRAGLFGRARDSAAVSYLGRISYALFLVHFPVCLLVNAVFTRFLPADAGVQAMGMVCAWVLSVLAAMLFHQRVELPLGQLASRLAGPSRPVRKPA